jgi:hypothetical protein
VRPQSPLPYERSARSTVQAVPEGVLLNNNFYYKKNTAYHGIIAKTSCKLKFYFKTIIKKKRLHIVHVGRNDSFCIQKIYIAGKKHFQ